MFKRRVYYLVIFCLLIVMFVGCSGNPTIPPIPEPDVEVYEGKTNEEGVAHFIIEDSLGEKEGINVNVFDSNFSPLTNIETIIIVGDTDNIVILLKDPKGIYIPKITSLDKNLFKSKGEMKVIETLIKATEVESSDSLEDYPPQEIGVDEMQYLLDENYIPGGIYSLDELAYTPEDCFSIIAGEAVTLTIGVVLIGTVLGAPVVAALIIYDILTLGDTFNKGNWAKLYYDRGWLSDDLFEVRYLLSGDEKHPYVFNLGDPGEYTRPVISKINFESPVVLNEEVEITCLASDRDKRGELTYNWNCCDEGEIISVNGSTIIWKAPEKLEQFLYSKWCNISCKVEDPGGASDYKKISIEVVKPEQVVISELRAKPETMGLGGTAIITCAAECDTDGEIYYYWKNYWGDFSSNGSYFQPSLSLGGTLTGSCPSIKWTAPSFNWSIGGIYTITCTAYRDEKNCGDPYQAWIERTHNFSDLKEVQIKIGNKEPVIISITADPSSININKTTTIICIASDPDDDTLIYKWNKNDGTFEGETSGPTITWRAPSTPNNYTVECEVSDGNGGQAANSLDIEVIKPKVLQSLTVVPDTMNFTAIGQQKDIQEIILGWLDGSTSSLSESEAIYLSMILQ